jgi:fucose permease
MAALGLPLTTQFVLVAAVLAAVSAVAACGLAPDAERTQPVRVRTGSGRRRTTVPLLALMTFLAAWVEDAPASWSGVYLRHVGAGAAMAAGGYAAFSAGSVLARLVNDWSVDRIGWARLIRAGTVSCAAALTAALLLGEPGIMLAALVVAGAGISAVFPGAFTAAGALPDAAVAMGQVGFAGNLGWLTVSPAIGALATLAGLPTALGLLVVAALTVAGLASVTGSAPSVRPGPSASTRPSRRSR